MPEHRARGPVQYSARTGPDPGRRAVPALSAARPAASSGRGQLRALPAAAAALRRARLARGPAQLWVSLVYLA